MDFMGAEFKKLMAELVVSLEPEKVQQIVQNIAELTEALNYLAQEVKAGRLSISIELRRIAQ